MNSKIKPRVANENSAAQQRLGELTSRTMKSSLLGPRSEKPPIVSGVQTYQSAIHPSKPQSGRPTTSYKNFLSPTRDAERLAFEAKSYDVLFVDVESRLS